MDHSGIYGSLNVAQREIRLLRLLPGNWDEALRCDLRIASLDAELEYQSLSYVWGKSGITKTIRLNGESFEVTQNLWAALRRLRRLHHERIIWVDATCINQRDLIERSNQVAIMGEIFSRASQVFIWLGDSISENDALQSPSPGDIELGRDLSYICENLARVLENSTYVTQEHETLAAFGMLYLLSVDAHWNTKPILVEDSSGRYQLNKNYLAAWQAMLHLLEFPWWSRVWVVQELVLAKTATLVVGSVTVPWQLISDFCNSYAKHLPPGACCHASATWKMSKTLWDDIVLMRLTFWSFFSAKLERLQFHKSKGAAMAFWEYLWLLRHKESTDPRDKVYGLLGLLHGHCDSILAPDYSLTIAETYSMCMETLIRSDQTLNALVGPRLCKPGLPTFAIDLLPTDKSGSVLFFQNSFKRICSSVILNASKGQGFDFLFEMGTLKLRGILFDRVEQVATPWEEDFVAEKVLEWESLSRATGKCHDLVYPNGRTRADAFWRTIVRDTIRDYRRDEQVRRANMADKDSYSHFREWLTNKPIIGGSDLQTDADFTNFRKSFYIAAQHQQFFTSGKGYIGLADPVHPEDEIWILFGGQVPFILRPFADNSSHSKSYSLVGDCYLHGVMDGEAVEILDGCRAQDIYMI